MWLEPFAFFSWKRKESLNSTLTPDLQVLCNDILPSVFLLVLNLYAAVLGFLNEYLPSDRKGLAVYPIFLFYCAITALILATGS